MHAKTFNCPMCGAPTTSDASQCQHCGARLATVSCPSCFELMFQGQKHCPNCGALAARTELEGNGAYRCPRCPKMLHSIEVGGTVLLECEQCDGLWLDNRTFEELCRKREKQTTFIRIPSLQDPTPDVRIDPVQYLKCPRCATLMNRVNFASCSGVIVDICKSHGTWFDRAELRRIIDFIQGGGMDKAREREIQRLAQERRAVEAQRALGSGGGASLSGWSGTTDYGAADLLGAIAEIAWNLFT